MSILFFSEIQVSHSQQPQRRRAVHHAQAEALPGAALRGAQEVEAASHQRRRSVWVRFNRAACVGKYLVQVNHFRQFLANWATFGEDEVAQRNDNILGYFLLKYFFTFSSK